MGKHMVSSGVEIQGNNNNNNPGCMWGMFHVLDYHRWRVKKVFPNKRKRHARYKRETVLYNQSEDHQQYKVTEAEPLLQVMQHSENLSATSKRSPRIRKKEPQTEIMFNEENLEGCSTKDGKTTEAAFKADISNKFKKNSDVSEVFRMEKDLLLKFLRDLDVGGKKFLQASHNKARLTKSGSFPLTSTSQMRNKRSSTLKHKQNEIWAFPKGEHLLDGTQASIMSISMPLVSDLGMDGAMKQKLIIASRSSQGSTHKGWNQMILHQFKVVKQKIKHALFEFRKSSYQTSALAIHHRSSPEHNSITNNEEGISKSIDDGVIQEHKTSNESKPSDYDSNKHNTRLMRRTSSLNESLDRYTQLFEKSFSKDVKWQSSKSKSLKLTNEDSIHKSGHAPKFSRSNFSLPSLETLGFILHEALLDTNDIGNTMESGNHVRRKSVSLPLKIGRSHEATGKIDEEVECDQKEDIHEPEVQDESFLSDEKEEMGMTICEDNTTSHAEGTELNALGSKLEELETDLSYKGDSFPDSASNRNSSVTAKDMDKSSDNHFQLFKSDSAKGSKFSYVKDILEFSGFLRNEHNQMQYTLDQPLKPSLFKDLEVTFRHEIESSGEETINTYDHHLLFNLVNEVLLEMNERSPTYFPRPFSFNYRLSPMPKGHHLLNEVWTSVDSYLSLRPELDQTLDDVVGRDLAKTSGWMILQQEEECVALELEEMIIQDLLDEFIFS